MAEAMCVLEQQDSWKILVHPSFSGNLKLFFEYLFIFFKEPIPCLPLSLSFSSLPYSPPPCISFFDMNFEEAVLDVNNFLVLDSQ